MAYLRVALVPARRQRSNDHGIQQDPVLNEQPDLDRETKTRTFAAKTERRGRRDNSSTRSSRY